MKRISGAIKRQVESGQYFIEITRVEKSTRRILNFSRGLLPAEVPNVKLFIYLIEQAPRLFWCQFLTARY